MHINDSLCPPPMQWGVGQGESPALMQGTGGQCLLVLLPDALWPWGVGVWGSTAPFFWHWSPFTESPWWSQGTGGPKAEVKMVLSRKKSCSPHLPAGHPQDEYEAVTVGAEMASRCLYPVGSRGQILSPNLSPFTEILSGGATVPPTPCLGRTSSSSCLADAPTYNPCS